MAVGVRAECARRKLIVNLAVPAVNRFGAVVAIAKASIQLWRDIGYIGRDRISHGSAEKQHLAQGGDPAAGNAFAGHAANGRSREPTPFSDLNVISLNGELAELRTLLRRTWCIVFHQLDPSLPSCAQEAELQARPSVRYE